MKVLWLEKAALPTQITERYWFLGSDGSQSLKICYNVTITKA